MPTYSLAETSRLVGISRDKVSRWIKGYKYTYSWGGKEIGGKQNAVVRPKDKEKEPYASFLDIIDLLFVKKFRENGLSLQYIRKALDEVRERFGIPHFASRRFFAFGSKMLLETPKDSQRYIGLLTGGQIAFPQIVEEIGEKIDFEDVTGFGLAARWYPLGNEGLIVIDPKISFGRPSLVGRGVATENIYDLYLGESEKVEPVSDWFEIPKYEIQAAVRFESEIAG